MRTSESIGDIAAAFVAAQSEVSTVKRDSKVNAGKYGYSYATLAAVVEAISGPLGKHGLGYVQTVTQGDRSCTVTTRLIHKSGQWFEGDCEMPIAGGGAQAVGSAITYGRRYGLTALLGVATDDDDDGAEANRNAPKRGPVAAKSRSYSIGNDENPAAEIKAFRERIAKVKTEADLHELAPMAANLHESVKGEARALWTKTTAKLKAAKNGEPPHDPATGEVLDGDEPPPPSEADIVGSTGGQG